ncbi:MAG: hypothetical protein IJU36_01415 [Paludibacteraceae bacterium]|nr:hypothetical protein [Paludibacteraceae bacterium]
MQIKKYLYYITALVLSCTACQHEPAVQVTLPVAICLPTEETQVPMNRVPGDPGTTEEFLLPNHVYIFVMKYDTEAGKYVVWHRIEKTLAESDWEKKHYVGLLQTTGDSIYEYTEEINLLLEATRFDGRVYVIASAEPLTFTPKPDLADITNETELLDEKFSMADSTMQHNVQHIYSTPYNYIVDDEYYGSFRSQQRVPNVNLMLYHVAAKVDINWTVPTDKRIKADPDEAVRLTYMQAVNLFDGWAYCFKPMANVVNPLPTTGYSRQIVSPGDVGRWWEGRDYFYTIPYTTPTHSGYFPLQMVLKTNGSEGTGYRPTLYMEMDDTTFVPWLRADFTINNPLEDGTDTKIVPN